jgi:hypothetical protein
VKTLQVCNVAFPDAYTGLNTKAQGDHKFGLETSPSIPFAQLSATFILTQSFG